MKKQTKEHIKQNKKDKKNIFIIRIKNKIIKKKHVFLTLVRTALLSPAPRYLSGHTNRNNTKINHRASCRPCSALVCLDPALGTLPAIAIISLCFRSLKQKKLPFTAGWNRKMGVRSGVVILDILASKIRIHKDFSQTTWDVRKFDKLHEYAVL